MAEKRKPVLIADMSNGDETVVEPEDYSLEKDLVEILSGDPDQSEVILYRQKTANHKDGLVQVESWSGDIAKSGLIYKAARDHKKAAGLYGEDVYFRVNVRKNGGLVPGKSTTTFILGAQLAEAKSLPTVGTDNTALLMNFMERQAAEQREFMRQMLSNKTDPKAEVKEMLGLMVTMREAMGLPAPGAQVVAPAQIDPMAMMKSAMDFVTGATEARSKLIESLGLQTIGGDDEKEESLVDVVKEIFPGILKTINNEQQLRAMQIRNGTRPPAAPTARPAMRAEKDVVLENPAPVAENVFSDAPIVPQQIEDFLKRLQEEAVNETDVEELLEAMMEDPEILGYLKMLPSVDKPFRMVVDIVPDALDYAYWWSDLIELAREKMADGTDSANKENPASPGAGGPDANAQPDG